MLSETDILKRYGKTDSFRKNKRPITRKKRNVYMIEHSELVIAVWD